MPVERLDQFKNPITSSEFELATFRSVAQCLNQLRYRVGVRNEILIIILTN
jgi:hypothetical protein